MHTAARGDNRIILCLANASKVFSFVFDQKITFSISYDIEVTMADISHYIRVIVQLSPITTTTHMR